MDHLPATTTTMDATEIIATITTIIEITTGGITIVEMEGETIIVVVGDMIHRMETTEGEVVASMASAAVEGATEDGRTTLVRITTTTITIGIAMEGRSAITTIAEEGTAIIAEGGENRKGDHHPTGTTVPEGRTEEIIIPVGVVGMTTGFVPRAVGVDGIGAVDEDKDVGGTENTRSWWFGYVYTVAHTNLTSEYMRLC
mmetsp:Transcript_27031/g.43941  ORF Transcript_27031/g.43941 Transcript_27031/m.43941 type:complete len:199 (+) Transcript_27031:713-1309(+)